MCHPVANYYLPDGSASEAQATNREGRASRTKRASRTRISLRKEVSAAEKKAPLPSIAGIGLLAGGLSGLFGVGGGVVMVPLQMLFLGESIKAAVRTSLGAIVAIAISGLAQHTWNGNVLWIPGLCLGLGGIIGAQAGTRLLPRLPDRTVNFLFKFLLFALAAYMIVRGIQGWR
ncbi:MAG: sulfite exporter TauE/SafE family protein [Leptolyngbyaceae cyanobacterium SL_5_14]|nr:sulfite exporter TauE/SafE family protein [Leptolyngbyaceae cyanobacterium SL_5_14]